MAAMKKEVTDKGGRRLGIDRRQVDIEEVVEGEQRSEKERRSGVDRRDDWSYKDDPSERRESFIINTVK